MTDQPFGHGHSCSSSMSRTRKAPLMWLSQILQKQVDACLMHHGPERFQAIVDHLYDKRSVLLQQSCDTVVISRDDTGSIPLLILYRPFDVLRFRPIASCLTADAGTGKSCKVVKAVLHLSWHSRGPARACSLRRGCCRLREQKLKSTSWLTLSFTHERPDQLSWNI